MITGIITVLLTKELKGYTIEMVVRTDKFTVLVLIKMYNLNG